MTYAVRWADMDANRHMTYSAYIDTAAELRYRFFSAHGLPPEVFEQLGVGPVYTNLNATFYREVRLGETLTVTYQMAGLSPSGLRWKVRHDFLKESGKKAVTVLVEGTILNMLTRQPTPPVPQVMAVFQLVPRSADFSELSDSRWF